MADAATHAHHALQYITTADSILDTHPAAAGEIMWLAAVQAAQASGHQRNDLHHPQSRRGIRSIVGQLPVSNSVSERLLSISNLTAANLHGLAYRPADIDERQHKTDIERAKELANVLLRHA